MQLYIQSHIFFICALSALMAVKGSTLHKFSNQTSERPFEWVLNLDTWESKDTDSILPNAIYTNCGGVIPITTTLDYIDYYPTGQVLLNQRCVWSLSSEYANLEVFVDRQTYFRTDVGLSVITYNDSVTARTLNRTKIPTGDKQNPVPYPSSSVAFLVFSSQNLVQGEGFRLAVKGSGGRTTFVGFKTVRNELSGTLISHANNYANNERSWVVIQPPVNYAMTMTITALDTEPSSDFLFVYKLLHHSSTIIAILPTEHSGFYPFGPPNSPDPPTREPCIFFLRTDNTVTKKGFSLLWG